MRWPIPSFASATLCWRTALCLGCVIPRAALPGQTVEIWRAQSQNAPEHRSEFGTISVVDSKDVLSLQNDVVVANTTLLAQNEPLSPSEFNPDPGASQREQAETPEAPELFPPILPQLPDYGQEALPRSLQLPRKGVREVVPRRKKLEYETYPQSEEGEGLLPFSRPEPNRWFIGFGRWKRYADPSTETPYQSDLHLWHPYLQSKLKGDAPIVGQDIFLNITAEDFFQFEARKLPTPSGVSAARPNSSEFFGLSDQEFWSNDFSIGIDLFKGETAFKPIDWALRLLGVYNHNYFEVEENNVVNPNPPKGTTGELTFDGDFDNNSRHYDKNGFLTRPNLLGTVVDHYLQAYYLGWTGDGHIGWLNIDHAFYQVLGEDGLNGIAGQRTDINAQMAALELSVDKDWMRHKLSVFYASGDDDPVDSHATGFDTVVDRPFFIGGPFSFFSHQGFNLARTAGKFKQRDSLVIDFRTSKSEGQANFVNPGALLFGYGFDAHIF